MSRINVDLTEGRWCGSADRSNRSRPTSTSPRTPFGRNRAMNLQTDLPLRFAVERQERERERLGRERLVVQARERLVVRNRVAVRRRLGANVVRLGVWLTTDQESEPVLSR